MSFHNWLQNLRSALAPKLGQRHHRRRCLLRAARHRLNLELLEDRLTPSFSPAASFAVGGSPLAVVTGDFNGDGHLDLATANPNANTISVLLGDGAGGFGAAINSSLGVFPNWDDRVSLTVADFDNDGDHDLAFVAQNSLYSFGGQGGVLLSNGDGTFGSPTSGTPFDSEFFLRAVAAGDFNNDGNSDLVATGLGGVYLEASVLHVWLGNGQGGFTESQARLIPYSLTRLTVGDLNGDGNLDAVGTLDGEYGPTYGGALLGNGAGKFVSPFNNFGTHNAGIRGLAVGDFTGDGIPDLIMAGESVEIRMGRGSGGFDFSIAQAATASVHTGVAVADFDGDGLLDAVTSDAKTGTVRELLGNGDSTLTDAAAYAVGSSPSGIAVGDFNEDGRPDVATANAGSGTVSVLLNDGDGTPPPPPPLPSLRIDDVSITEGNTGTTSAQFIVTLSAASTETVTVTYATGNDTAVAGSDYQPMNGTLTFAPGETSKIITVLVNGDRFGEANETFFVDLSSATNATIADSQGVGTITDDEPRISITPSVSQAEGNSGQTPMAFAVTLSSAYDAPVTVDWSTADGSAIAGSDYQAASGTLTFAPGETSKTITILINGDQLPEPNETFRVNLNGATNAIIQTNSSLGTITNDDVAGPKLRISDVTKKEGRKGKTSFTFTVTLSAPSTMPVTVSYATADGTAKVSDGDYYAMSGTLTFEPGQTSKTITVNVRGDRKSEANETFFVNLLTAIGAEIEDGLGLGTIVNDD